MIKLYDPHDGYSGAIVPQRVAQKLKELDGLVCTKEQAVEHLSKIGQEEKEVGFCLDFVVKDHPKTEYIKTNFFSLAFKQEECSSDITERYGDIIIYGPNIRAIRYVEVEDK